MTGPAYVWIVKTKMNDLHGWFYVDAETETEARQIVADKRPGEEVIAAKQIENLDHVPDGGFAAVPVGDYWGPLIR